MSGRGIIQDRPAPEDERDCWVTLSDEKTSRDLAVSFASLARQLERQPPGRGYTRIRFDRETRRMIVELEVSE